MHPSCSSSAALNYLRCLRSGVEGCDQCTPAGFSELLRRAEPARPLQGSHVRLLWG